MIGRVLRTRLREHLPHPKNTLGMVKAVIALLAGKSDPTWIDLLRLKLFYWLIG